MGTAVAPRLRADDVEATLIQLDRDFATIYGPNMGHWSSGVRGEFIEMQRTRRTADREMHPLHPRRASAGRRRRHARQLAWRIHQVAPDAATVLLNPYWSDSHGPAERVYVVTARDANGNRIKLPRGGSRRIASLMQGAFPAANWDTVQTWNAERNLLSAWRKPVQEAAR